MLEYVSGRCGHGFESHSQPFLLAFPELKKVYDVLSSLFQSTNITSKDQFRNHSQV